jgi:AAA ATPase domain/TIR domain
MREPLLFINYRTADTGAAASGLARALKRELEPGQIFIDYLGIEGGEPWKVHLRERVERATVLFALIGKDWLRTADPETRLRRLDQEDDWVRWEIECCLKRGTKIVPILVDDAPRLEQYDLPASIQPIAGLQTRPFRTTVAFESDVKRLVNLLQNEGFLRQAHPWRVSPDSIYNRIELHRFVGRDWLAARLDEFLSTHRNGYFVVEAQSGMGKTAFLAHLVETRGYIHHFVELQPGAAGIIPGLRNLAAQIVRAFGLEPEWIDDLLSGIGTRADFLERLLVVAASRGRTSDPVVIVVDGLNEAGTPETQNVLGLPRKLPEGFFFVVSQRPVEVRLQTESAREVVTIDAADEANLRDVAAYVQNSLPEDCSAASELVRRSHGNWVYIHHVCREIREGNRDPHDHEGLPQGLWQYYARFWMQWRSSHQDRWRVSHLPLLCTLSAAQESLTLSSLSELAGVEDGALYGLMTIDWRPFMTVTLEADGEHFELYHASLRDFAGGFAPLDELTSAERAFANELSATARERHAGIAELWLQRWGGTKLNELRTRDGVNHRNDYGWRHVVEHLALAGEEDVLESLLRAEWTFHEEIPNLMPGWMGRLARWARGRKGATHLVIPRNAWFESHARSGDLALFLEDWARATRARRLSGKSGPAGHATQDRQIVLELAAFLVKNSTRDAALRVPAGILIALVRSGRWSSDQAIAYARQVADSATRAELLTEISHRDGTMRPALIRDAIEAIESLEMPDKRVVAFARLLDRCPDEGRDAIIRRAFNVLPKLEATAFVENAPRIAPYLAPSHWEIYLALVNGLRTPLLRLRALAASAAASNTASLLQGALIQARNESLEDAETATYAERSLALAVVASLSTGAEAAKYADSSLEAAALVIETPGPTLEEEAYEAVAVVASAFAERVPGDLLASTIESLLSIRYPGEPSQELVLLAMSGSITTVEQQRSKLAARLISVAPAPTMRKIEAAVLRTKVRFHDWYPYRYLARRYAELGDTRRALRIVRKIGLERDRNETLGEIAGNLDEEGVRAGLAIVDAERTRLARVKSYSDMRHFEVEQAEVGLGAIVGLLPRLAALGCENEALARVRQLRPGSEKREWDEILSGLARHVSADALDELLRTSMAFRDIEQVVATLAELAPFLPEEKVRALIPAIRRIGYSRNTLERLSWSRVQRSASGIKDLELRIGALHALSLRLAMLGHHEDALRELVIFLQDADRERTATNMADCLGEIARVMPRDALRQALHVAARHNDQARPLALQALVPALSPESLDEALVIARSVRESGCQAWGIACLLPLADEQRRPALVREAMEGLNEPFWDRPRVLGLLAPHFERALDEIREYMRNGEEHGLTCLLHLLPNATASLSEELTGLAGQVYDEGQMLEVAEFLPEPVFLNTLDHVVADAPKALDKHDSRLASVSQRLLKLEDASRALTFALRIEDRFLRTRTTRQMASALKQLSREELLALWSNDFLLSTERSRRDAFGFVAALAPLVYALGGQEAILKLYETIAETGRWWY